MLVPCIKVMGGESTPGRFERESPTCWVPIERSCVSSSAEEFALHRVQETEIYF